MNSQKKKRPSQYPLFAIRLTEEQKAKLNDLVEVARTSLNEALPADEKLWMKNDVVFQALMLGLPLLKKKAIRKD